LLFIVGLNALAAGYSFIIDPFGRGLGMTADYLRHSSFNDYLIPGIILFIANGVLSIITAIITLKQYRGYHIFIINQGSILTGWIIIQVILVRDFNWMHLICILIGSALNFFRNSLKNKARTASIISFNK